MYTKPTQGLHLARIVGSNQEGCWWKASTWLGIEKRLTWCSHSPAGTGPNMDSYRLTVLIYYSQTTQRSLWCQTSWCPITPSLPWHCLSQVEESNYKEPMDSTFYLSGHIWKIKWQHAIHTSSNNYWEIYMHSNLCMSVHPIQITCG